MGKVFLSRVLLLVCSCCLFSLLYSQSATRLRFGITAGPALTSIWGDLKPLYGDASTHRPKVSWLAGVAFDYVLNPKLCLLAEPTFETRGSNAVWQSWMYSYGLTEIDDVKENFSYVSLPLLARYYFERKEKYFLTAGLAPAYLLGHNPVQLADDLNANRYRNATHMNPKFDLGLPVGLGLKWNARPNNTFLFELRYQLGITNLNKEPDSYDKSARHSMAHLRVSTFLDGKK